jgi:isocitrate lyase
MADRQLFAYNLSPSFPWYKSGLTDEDLREFCVELGKLGFVWHFITLAGMHALHLISTMFAERFATEGMYAYVDMIQGVERDIGSSALLHNKWSGSELVDAMTQIALGNDASNSLNGAECTESNF